MLALGSAWRTWSVRREPTSGIPTAPRDGTAPPTVDLQTTRYDHARVVNLIQLPPLPLLRQ